MKTKLLSVLTVSLLAVMLAGCATSGNPDSALPEGYTSGDATATPKPTETPGVNEDLKPFDATMFDTDNMASNKIKIGEVVVLGEIIGESYGYTLTAEKAGIVTVDEKYEMKNISGIPVKGIKEGVTRVAVASIKNGETQPYQIYEITVEK
jgi:PBP1b-binding outer membrane lipoprotein LpoB